MKNENIDKKSKGYKIGFILMSVLASLLLIFNLMSLYSLGVKDKLIKDLTTETTQVDVKPNYRITNSYTDYENTTWDIKAPTDFVNVTYMSTSKNYYVSGSFTIDFNGNTYNYTEATFRRNDSSTFSLYFSDTRGSMTGAFQYSKGSSSNFLYIQSTNTYYQTSSDTSTLTIGSISDGASFGFLESFLSLNASEHVVIPDTPDTPDSPISYVGEYIDVIDFSKTNPLIYWSNTLYNNGSMYQGTGSTIYITGVEFVSNGFLFNKIKIITLSLGGVNLTTDNYVIDDSVTTAYSGYSMFFTMFYEYESTERNYSIHVCAVGTHYLPHSTASTNFGICYNPLEKQWVNEEYKTLNVVTASDDICSVPSYNNLTGLELLRLQSDFTSSTLGDTNIFALLSQAFSAFASILAIRIIPGISIGLLIFIPLVVSIIITIIKLIGK